MNSLLIRHSSSIDQVLPQKDILILLTDGMEKIMEPIKNAIMNFFFQPSRWADKYHVGCG